MSDASRSTELAEVYYDSADADQFYYRVWGGEDIHIGIYNNDTDSIRVASRRTIFAMMNALGDALQPTARVIDLGAGYGGAARVLAAQRGCHVTCLNLSETQNARNRTMNLEQGLDDLIDVVHGNFEALPFADASFDVAWSQDAILHSGRRQQVIDNIARVLKPGGWLVFTDPMQHADAPLTKLQPILDRIHLSSLASVEFYRHATAQAGFGPLRVNDLSAHLTDHYARVHRDLDARRHNLLEHVSVGYIDRMLKGLNHWIEAGQAGLLTWAIMHAQKLAG